MNDPRRETARKLLEEVVYRSREPGARPGTGTGLCGLGDRSPVFKGLGPEYADLLKALFGGGAPERARAVSDVCESWLAEKDRIDRDRNHFLKKFRHEHGFDRRAYAEAVEKAFAEGVSGVNAAEDAALDEHARRLAELARG